MVLTWDTARVKQFFLEQDLTETIADALLPQASSGKELEYISWKMSDADVEAIAVKCTSRTYDKSRVVDVLRETDWTTANLK